MNSLLAKEQLDHYCQRWGIAELLLFGSAAREELKESSDIDLLYRFKDFDRWTVPDLLRMKVELEELLQRNVDLVSLESVEQSANKRAKNEILTQARVLYPHAA
jgi:predicted nucleotidyltransferase